MEQLSTDDIVNISYEAVVSGKVYVRSARGPPILFVRSAYIFLERCVWRKSSYLFSENTPS
jgi:hypothetical protein